ncbi:MAG: DUF5054 domain-containing protein [Alsobacter sp.]
MDPERIHLIFKTHLDIGFTDHAEKVRRIYHERFIPQAIETGEHFFRENPDEPKFIWTTGAWLIWDHLEIAGPAESRRLERAITRGLIRWHALPFTTHTELMTPTLFRAGLSYSAELDQRFGVRTIAAKMTDVPGHTRGIVPLLAEAGVKFLHLGVNTASPVPDVPDVFRWVGPGGEEVVVMYQNSYGATHLPEGLPDALSFAHTQDNIGPQSVSQTAEVLRRLQAKHPQAAIRAATLEEYGSLLWAVRDRFPALDYEIGDSWIQGVASDPAKTARFLALQRLYEEFAETGLTAERRAFGRGLTLVAEHTWGVDIKTFLRDDKAWDRGPFEVARASDYRFQYAERSWAEQRAYLDAAVAKLESEDRGIAERSILPSPPPDPGEAGILSEDPLDVAGWEVTLDPTTGDIARLRSPTGATLEGLAGSLLGFRHESYDHEDVQAQMDSYILHREDWAILDHDKPGLKTASTAQSGIWRPQAIGARATDGVLVVSGIFEGPSTLALGAPAQVALTLEAAGPQTLEIRLVLRGKPANRMPEAGFLHLTPRGFAAWDSLKMGLWQPAGRIVRRGGGSLQAVSGLRAQGPSGARLEIQPLDTPLVAPADKPFMRFDPTPPDLKAGMRFNLYNNKWGTNFPMWWEGDLVARFRLSVWECAAP